MPKIIPPPKGFIWTDVYFLSAVAALCFCNAVISALSNLGATAAQPQTCNCLYLLAFHLTNSSPLSHASWLHFSWEIKHISSLRQKKEFLMFLFLRAQLVKLPCLEHAINVESLKPRSRAKRRSETQQQPISYAPLINYSTFSLWKISNSRAY